MISENQDLSDAIASARRDSTLVGSKEDALSAEKVAGREEVDADVVSSKKEGSENNGKKDSELSAFNLEMESVPEED